MDALVEFIKLIPTIGGILLIIVIAFIMIAIHILIFVWKAGYMARRNAEEMREMLLELQAEQASKTEKTE